jgi:hypothetical protein
MLSDEKIEFLVQLGMEAEEAERVLKSASGLTLPCIQKKVGALGRFSCA